METEQHRALKVRAGGSLLPALLHQQVKVQPDAIAVTGGEGELTYRELDRSARLLAAHLRALGVSADDCVGLFVEPSLELVSDVWGILFAGGAYLPLSPEYPEDRLRYMLEDSGAEIVVTQRHLAARLAEMALPGVAIVTPEDAAGAADEPATAPAADSLAYVIYTSGSTGKPKGVMIEHRSIAAQMRWLHAFGHLGGEAVVLQKTPVSFDAAQWEIFAPAFGGRLVIAAPGAYRDPEVLIAAIAEHEVTTLQCVPTLLQALLDTERLRTCTSLRRVFSGGEALSRQLAQEFTDELPWASLINLYGPTECTINATAHLVDPDELPAEAGTIPIGVPVDNTQCFVLDENTSPADIGEVGELYIGGAQLARGYLNRPGQTAERFVPSPFVPTERLYRTGDLAYWRADGSIQFAGRQDNQVKLRGYRVELDEISVAIEEHTWVRRATAVVADDARTGFQNLVACIELNPKEAALMDQGNHGAHHRTKTDKVQVKAQLSNPGLRAFEQWSGRPVVRLPGARETEFQRRECFARKTYRFYDGGEVTEDDLRALLAPRRATARSRSLDEITLAELGELLRWFGQFQSQERLLPKYSYASPGALYAAQLYLDVQSVAGVDAGMYYYHPLDHALVRVGESWRPGVAVHLVGKHSAIEPVYKNNIREVLEFEAGHLVGVFEEVLPGYGLAIEPAGHEPSVREHLDVADEDYYLGSFDIAPHENQQSASAATEIFLQVHPERVRGMQAGQYRWNGGEFERISDQLVLPKHVIAINQAVYERASFGITAVSRGNEPWLEYIALGTALHHLQRNAVGLGLMSSGYSSKSGHPLPASRRIDDILTTAGLAPGASYFFLGGKVSEEQIRSEGMREDAVHMRGPAEIVKDDLTDLLPEYMIPNRVLVFDELPLTANGKIDRKALADADEVRSARSASPYVEPATPVEQQLAELWGGTLKYADVSVEDEFFAVGGNSLLAVTLVNKINQQFDVRLPLQVLFERPKLADLAARIEDGCGAESSRLALLRGERGMPPVFCWPGLGGYPMNLRALAGEAGVGRAFYGVQARGINPGELPHPTIAEMAAADVEEIRGAQPTGPYELWGYSFGARVAFETAWHLEQLGERVEKLLLICPGNPKIRRAGEDGGREASYRNPTYLTILLSVFTGSITGPEVAACLSSVDDEHDFVEFVHELSPELDRDLIRRIVRIVRQTYEFEYTFRELAERQVETPVTIFKAAGDDYSFIEGHSGFSAAAPTVIDLRGDHYAVLKTHGVAELAEAIHRNS